MEGLLDEYLAKICIERKWDVWTKNRPKVDFIINEMQPYLRPGDRVCEIGIGDGYLLDKLSKLGMDCTGVDISGFLVQYHKNRVAGREAKIEFIRGNIVNLDLEPSQFNFIFCIDIIEHLTEAESILALKNIYNMLKPGGIIAVSFPYNENLYASMTKCPECGNEFHKVGHKQIFDSKKIKNIFGATFKIKKIGEIDWNICEKIPFYKRGVSIEGFIRRMRKIFKAPFIGKENGNIDISTGETCYVIAEKYNF